MLEENEKNKNCNRKYSKIKGKNGERELAKILEQYFSYKFLRVPNSGAFLGGKNIVREKELEDNQIKLFKGDIIVPDNLKNIVFECKFYKDFSLRSCLKNNNQLLNLWIKQIENTINKELWFLCIKTNNKGWVVVFDFEHKPFFSLESYLIYFSSESKKKYIICDMKIFFSINKDTIIELSNNIDNQYR